MFHATVDGKESQSSSLLGTQPCHHFEFSEIQLATENFDESLVIGQGGFGKVYKGIIVNGSKVVVAAIKRLDLMSNQGAAEFWAEVEMLSKLRHCHLVSLIGYCNDGKEMILVYEYMPHGTLEDHLHKLGSSLSWLQRLKICMGAARGLDYLHSGTGIEHGVIHRDVKSTNILLDESWEAKISDFGLSRIGPKNKPSTYVNTLVKGTFGYLDPDYFRTGRLTRKSDVYAFGVVLFEVLCRKRAVDSSLDEEQWGLAGWAQDSIKEGSLKDIIDSDLRSQIPPKCLKEFTRIADRCLHDRPKERPTMAEVVFTLESILALQERTNNSLQRPDRTIFGRLVDMFRLPSKGEHSARGDLKLSSNSKGDGRSGRNTVGADNNMFLDTREAPADCRIISPNLQVFKFADLRRATGDFSLDMLLRDEGLGKLFLGWVDKDTFAPSSPGVGMAVAVKTCCQKSTRGDTEWLAELRFLGRLAHPSIISLLGYCNDEQENLLVYEHMQNRSFDCFLFEYDSVIAEPLSWGTRLNIMMGVARGLVYLHSPEVQVIHRGVKSSTILLDQDYNAKLGDFGVARSRNDKTTHALGSVVYLDPEYLMTGHLTMKSDIYSFGVVLLESLTGQRAIDEKRPLEQQNLVTCICLLEGELKKEQLEKIMDPFLQQKYFIEAALVCVELTVKCLALDPEDRPSSIEVLRTLEAVSAFTSSGHTSSLHTTIHER